MGGNKTKTCTWVTDIGPSTTGRDREGEGEEQRQDVHLGDGHRPINHRADTQTRERHAPG